MWALVAGGVGGGEVIEGGVSEAGDEVGGLEGGVEEEEEVCVAVEVMIGGVEEVGGGGVL